MATERKKRTLWHTPEQEPEREKEFLAKDSEGYSLYRWCGQYPSWNELCRIEHLKQWIYTEDLEKI